MKKSNIAPDKIKIRGGRVHNLKNIDVDIPLNQIVGMQVFRVRENHRWLLVFCMRKVQGGIWNRCQPIRAGV